MSRIWSRERRKTTECQQVLRRSFAGWFFCLGSGFSLEFLNVFFLNEVSSEDWDNIQVPATMHKVVFNLILKFHSFKLHLLRGLSYNLNMQTVKPQKQQKGFVYYDYFSWEHFKLNLWLRAFANQENQLAELGCKAQ